MKKILITAILLATTGAFSQVGIGTTTPNGSSILDLDSTTKGLLLPRVALVATNDFAPLSAHVAGMKVYNTATAGDVTPGEYYNDGAKWIKIGDATAASKWTNDATNTRVALTNLSDGTTARTAGTEFVVTDAGNVGVGTTAPSENLHVYDGIGPNSLIKIETGVAGAAGLKLSNPATVTDWWWYANSIGQLSAYHSDGANFIINKNGNVGIKESSPSASLHVTSDITTWPSAIFEGSNYSAGIDLKATGGSNPATYRLLSDNNNGDFLIYDVINTSYRMIIAANGNVGIGTLTPTSTAKLEVAGAIKVGTVEDAGATNGTIRYNTTTNKFQGYAAGAWVDLH